VAGDAELFHVYTTLIGPGLFFEVVERRGGYDGYGAANSPVRVAAQRHLHTGASEPEVSRAK
jgi:4-hydroxyphenylpyruvate dioxygenase